MSTTQSEEFTIKIEGNTPPVDWNSFKVSTETGAVSLNEAGIAKVAEDVRSALDGGSPLDSFAQKKLDTVITKYEGDPDVPDDIRKALVDNAKATFGVMQENILLQAFDASEDTRGLLNAVSNTSSDRRRARTELANEFLRVRDEILFSHSSSHTVKEANDYALQAITDASIKLAGKFKDGTPIRSQVRAAMKEQMTENPIPKSDVIPYVDYNALAAEDKPDFSWLPEGMQKKAEQAYDKYSKFKAKVNEYLTPQRKAAIVVAVLVGTAYLLANIDDGGDLNDFDGDDDGDLADTGSDTQIGADAAGLDQDSIKRIGELAMGSFIDLGAEVSEYAGSDNNIATVDSDTDAYHMDDDIFANFITDGTEQAKDNPDILKTNRALAQLTLDVGEDGIDGDRSVNSKFGKGETGLGFKDGNFQSFDFSELGETNAADRLTQGADNIHRGIAVVDFADLPDTIEKWADAALAESGADLDNLTAEQQEVKDRIIQQSYADLGLTVDADGTIHSHQTYLGEPGSDGTQQEQIRNISATDSATKTTDSEFNSKTSVAVAVAVEIGEDGEVKFRIEAFGANAAEDSLNPDLDNKEERLGKQRSERAGLGRLIDEGPGNVDDNPDNPESGPPESGPPESGPPESGPPESGPPESGPPESGPPESGPPDSKPPEDKPQEKKEQDNKGHGNQKKDAEGNIIVDPDNPGKKTQETNPLPPDDETKPANKP